LRTAIVCKPAPVGRLAPKPVEVLERGETDRLWRAVFLIGSGMPT
jgi:hypothetical protein